MKKSVAMGTYNGEAYIIEQLESIRKQTVMVDEVRISDDCSTDNTVRLIREYIDKFNLGDSWSISVNKKNSGYGTNFMNALKQTDGELIFFCDQDDIWLPDRIEKMEEIMKENRDVLLLGSEFEIFSDSENSLEIPVWELKQMKYDESLQMIRYNSKNMFIGCQGCSMCIRRELIIRTVDNWFEGWAHDEFVWRGALCLDGLYIYHAATLKRRLHENNASLSKMHTKEGRLKYLYELIRGLEATKNILINTTSDNSVSIVDRIIKASKLRINMISKKKIFNAVSLYLFYGDCFHKKRAILTEIILALKGSL